MKPQDIAKLGVRLIGLAAVTFGVVVGTSILIIQAIANSAAPVTTTTLHETTYTHIHYNFGLMLVPSVLSIVLGVVFISMSHSFAQVLTRGISHDVA